MIEEPVRYVTKGSRIKCQPGGEWDRWECVFYAPSDKREEILEEVEGGMENGYLRFEIGPQEGGFDWHKGVG